MIDAVWFVSFILASIINAAIIVRIINKSEKRINVSLKSNSMVILVISNKQSMSGIIHKQSSYLTKIITNKNYYILLRTNDHVSLTTIKFHIMNIKYMVYPDSTTYEIVAVLRIESEHRYVVTIIDGILSQ